MVGTCVVEGFVGPAGRLRDRFAFDVLDPGLAIVYFGVLHIKRALGGRK